MKQEFKQFFQRGIFQGLGIVFAIALSLGTVYAVTGLVGTYNSFSDGETLNAGKLNANFTSIKAALTSFKTALDATTGTISAYGGTSAPTGWFLCDGTAVSQTTYADLYAVIGCNFGCSGGNFNLPDLRGRFLRGRDGRTTRDPDSGTRTAMNTGGNTADNVGSVQVDDFKSHTHAVGTFADGTFNPTVRIAAGQRSDFHTNIPYTDATGGNETLSFECVCELDCEVLVAQSFRTASP